MTQEAGSGYTLESLARHIRTVWEHKGEWLTFPQAKDIAARQILEGFENRQEALAFGALGLASFTAEGLEIRPYAIRQAVEWCQIREKRLHEQASWNYSVTQDGALMQHYGEEDTDAQA